MTQPVDAPAAATASAAACSGTACSAGALAAAAVAEALETMAFVTAAPLPVAGDPPAGAVVVGIRFGGPVAGTIELAAPLAFGEMLAGNLLCPDPDEPPVPHAGTDALKELMNVACGLTLPRLSAHGLTGGLTGRFEMTVPTARPLAGADEWAAFAGGPHATAFDADGFKVAVRVRGAI